MKQITFDPSIPLALWVPLAVAVIGLVACYARSSRGRLRGRRRAVVVSLMAVAAAVPLAILLNPTWLERIPPPAGRPLLTILVDRSASMATPDAEEGQTRYQVASRIASQAASRLAEKYEIRLRCFADDSSLASPAELSRRKPDGPITDLARAIEDALDDTRAHGQAILLLGDGAHNAENSIHDLRHGVAKASALATPVYVKTIGGQTTVRDLSVALDRPREVAFVGQRVPVVVKLFERGSLSRRAKLTVRLNDEIVQQREVELPPGGQSEETIEVMQASKGLYRYEVRADPLPGEVTPLNNNATLVMRVVDEPVRVLLLEGKPYWDTKFLIRILATDPSIELVSVTKMAEGRLLERRVSRAADESGPGKGADPNQGGQKRDEQRRALRSDRWTIRKDAAKLLSDPEYLASYQIVLLGRGADVFLADEALATLGKWLKQRECSLVCFRGPPSSQISQRLGELMPVRWTPSRESRFRVRMTQSGRDLRWLARADDAHRLAGLPSLAAVARPEPRPLSETLAESVSGTDGQSDPVITYLRVGMGRVVVVEGAGMWRWAFLPPRHQQHDDTYGQLWRSLIRWLVANVQLLPSQQMALKLDKVTFNTTETAAADLLIREEHLGERVPKIDLSGAAIAQRRLIAPLPSGSYPGQFRVSFGKLPEGQYRARVMSAGKDEVAAVAAFDVRRGNLEEVLQVEAKPEQMKFIAEHSGGSVLTDVDPEMFARQFDQHLARSRPERTAQTLAWDRWWVLLGVVGLWGAAWGLRRRSGLV